MIIQSVRRRLDHVGIGLSLLCAVHCTLMPLILTSLPLWGLGFLANVYCEAAIITLSFIIASYSLIGGYKQTRSVGPLITLAVGFALIFAAQLLANEKYEWMLMVAGGLLVGSAHLYNWKVVHKASVKPHCCASSQCPNA
ncbi:MerC domain-containing protein [Mucilaginibacter sp. Bleaf8]|uniref:MerC domain-containing protein n=1 Tax=Mucilaginibacter sp. Bleaf8 TaxID=2834430 RepID=UPI001BCF0589|nr:MerC domain-containing protein [Mucilaginibacter sp. Bleaf8]MBS7567042.1 MerC domain-containing protein [Mucilaginibacter sp. Bleaf8]